MQPFAIAIHGGAGTILASLMTLEKEQQYRAALQEALLAGHAHLAQGGTALEAVELSVRSLEDYPLFNAGRGSVFTHEGTHEMDASIMDGITLNAGAVTGIMGVKNPVTLARLVMQYSGHVMLAAEGAEAFGREMDVDFREPDYFFTDDRHRQWLEIKDTDAYQLDHSKEKKFGTVGAVALDMKGNLAAATSTGGMTNKRYGRIGDSPVIGAGTYADNEACAVSCTGHGEYFLRTVVAYDVVCLMKYKGLSLQEAAHEVVQQKLVKIGGEGGLIAVDKAGSITMPFNSAGMYRASVRNHEAPYISIYG